MFSIRILSSCDLKTSRDIGIGSTEEDVRKAYEYEINPEDDDDPEHITAGTVYGGVIFHLKDGIVTSIFIGAAAE